MPLNVKELKLSSNKWKNFKSIMEIMELNEINKLKKLVNVYNSNLVYFYEQKKLAKNIEKNLSLVKRTKFFETDDQKTKDKTNLYIIVSPQRNDSTAKALMKRTKEFLSELDKENNYFITFGYEANKLCNRLDLKIVDSINQFGVGEMEQASVSKIVSVASLSVVNSIVDEVFLIFPEIDYSSKDLYVPKLLPFNNELMKVGDDFSVEEELVYENSSKFFQLDNLRKTQWFPSMDTVYANLLESLIKIKMNIIVLKHKIHEQKEIIAQSKNQNKKVQELIEDLELKIQRGRKEAITLELSVLSSSFKVLAKRDEEIRDKEDEEEEEEVKLWNKEVEKIKKHRI